MPIIVVARRPSNYARRVILGMASAGKAPALVLLGSRVETLVGPIEKILRVRKQLGLREAISYVRRLRGGTVENNPPPPIDQLASQFGFPVIHYDAVNSGQVLVEIASRAPAIVVLAGTGLVDRAFLAANRNGQVVNGHPALLPGIRGVDVIEWALAEEKPLGVTAHLVSPSVDAGDILVKADIHIEKSDYNIEILKQRIIVQQSNAVVEAVLAISDGVARPVRHDLARSELRLTAPAHVHDLAQEKLMLRLRSLSAQT